MIRKLVRRLAGCGLAAAMCAPLLAGSPAHAAMPVTTITGGTEMYAGWQASSPNQAYRLTMQTDGNLVLYRQSDNNALWHTNTWGRPGAYAKFQTDGNLVVYSNPNNALWHSVTWDSPGATLQLQDDGNLVIYRSNGSARWFTDTWDRGQQPPPPPVTTQPPTTQPKPPPTYNAYNPRVPDGYSVTPVTGLPKDRRGCYASDRGTYHLGVTDPNTPKNICYTTSTGYTTQIRLHEFAHATAYNLNSLNSEQLVNCVVQKAGFSLNSAWTNYGGCSSLTTSQQQLAQQILAKLI
jgi:hypothetical protein